MSSSHRKAVREQVFDRSGTFVGTVARAALDDRGVEIEAYEIELDEEAAEEILGAPAGTVTVDPMELEIRDVLRLTSTIEEFSRSRDE